jgi:hypothetical protein
MSRTLGLAAFFSLAAACSTPQYAFVPATTATAEIDGTAAADYAIPPQSPTGELRVASYGIEPLAPGDQQDVQVGALHVRVFVSNTSDHPWTIDTREQRVTLEGRGPSTPAFATASPGDGSKPPTLTIPAKTSRAVDVFFPLPSDMQTAAELPAFEVATLIHTDAGDVAETTPFARVQTDDEPDDSHEDEVRVYAAYPYTYGYDYWASPFWYDPAYVGFYGGVYLPHAYYWGHPVIVRGPGWGRPGYVHGYHGGYRGGYHYHAAPHGYHGGGHGRR